MAENEQLGAAEVQEIEPENFEVENFMLGVDCLLDLFQLI